ncbi:MAG: ABC transporter permease, partial [bacterium]|nr:ABC transporter permease [bacterium]
YQEVRNLDMEMGSFISDQNEKGLSKVAVLGPTTRDDLFGEGVDPIGQRIKINNIYFTVIGVSMAKGGSGFTNQDDMVFVPLSSMQKFLSGDDYVSSIYIKAKDGSMMPKMQEQITALLLARHNISNPQLADFSLMNQADLVETASSVASTFTILLAAIAGISLLVGGIGIMNMMLTTVTERTREIGLRKAIGAKAKDISLQFLTEAVELTLIGGIVGIALGYLASILIARFTSLDTSVSLFSMVLAFSVSGLIGICFGYWPAKRASKLNPITALRYE